MALVTVQRSPNSSSVDESPQNQCAKSDDEPEDDEAGSKGDTNLCFVAANKETALVVTLKDDPAITSPPQPTQHQQQQHLERRLSTDSTRSTNSTQSNNSDIQQHLQSMLPVLHPHATLKMAVKLESQRVNRTRYLVIASRCCYRTTAAITTANVSPMASNTNRVRPGHKIVRHNSVKTTTSSSASLMSTSNPTLRHSLSSSTAAVVPITGTEMETPMPMPEKMTTIPSNLQQSGLERLPHNIDEKLLGHGDGTSIDANVIEESCLLGIDCNERTTIGLVVPILADTTIRLDGDGGFSVSVFGKTHIFKPASVQAMWSALQTLHKVSEKARENNFYPGGRSHEWLDIYDSRIESEQSCLNEWNAMDSLESRRPPSPDAIRNKPTAKDETEIMIKMKLKEIMMSVDLDEVTSKYIRTHLEEHMDMDLGEYKSYIDQEMLKILGQMDEPTEIFEHVYLGSEWNASNLEELQKNGVGHILNVTREIDNFFPGLFDYFNVRVYDDEKTDLLKHWDNTFRYITRAKAEGSKVLVHCKMGVSRSASVVIAYAMKAYNWEFPQALQHVKDRRNCIKPNKNFLNQLETYRGMLDAMKNKDKLQRSKSETNLKSSSNSTANSGATTATKDARLLPGSEPTPLIQALNHSKLRASAGDGIVVRGVVGGSDIISATGKIMTTTDNGARNSIVVSRGRVPIDPGTNTTTRMRTATTLSVSMEAAKQHRSRTMRRSSSTSPKSSHGQGHPNMQVMKQQSQSLENLTPERTVADEPKNVRFPGSNGENYSVSQNQVLHIQKNVPPPPPLPPPPTPPVSLTEAAHLAALAQQTNSSNSTSLSSSVRTIVCGLEAHQDGRKTADDRKILNLAFGRSISHDITASAGDSNSTVAVNHQPSIGESPVWTSSAKLITQTSHLGAISGRVRHNTTGCEPSISNTVTDMFSSQVDSVFAQEEESGIGTGIIPIHHPPLQHSRKTQSWAATSGGIVMDTASTLNARLGSNSSIDSAASITDGCLRSIQQQQQSVRQREQPHRHASWGSGDQRGNTPMRNSSWGPYDSNRNTFHCSTTTGVERSSAIVEGQVHDQRTTTTVTGDIVAGKENQQQNAAHLSGTVKRTKQKLEECTAQKKLCKENGSSQSDIERIVEGHEVDNLTRITTTSSINPPPKRGGTNLYRSASAAGGGTRARYPQRCNSEEMSASVFARVGISTVAGVGAGGRASDGCRPPSLQQHSDLFPYTLSDFANKNTNLDSNNGDVDGSGVGVGVLLRTSSETTSAGGGSAADQRLSGNVQTLKKNFEAKAEAAVVVRKGHQSLPSSPVAQHVDHQQNHQQEGGTDTGSVTTTMTASEEDETSVIGASASTITTGIESSVSTSSSASSSCASSTSSATESSLPSTGTGTGSDRNVKGLVHKYQAATTAPNTVAVTSNATTTTISMSSTTVTTFSIGSSNNNNNKNNIRQRPRSYYENLHARKPTAVGRTHDYGDSRPPPAPTRPAATIVAPSPPTSVLGTGTATNPVITEGIVVPQRRLQQHGKTHPLARLSLPKQSFNAAAYNTM